MRKSECMRTRVCEKDHTRKRKIVHKKENVWRDARKRCHEEESEHEGAVKERVCCCRKGQKVTRKSARL